uniref:uncharacterized protein LOC120343439 n=1 Tax=Styela clava TaxID=7725 RepID=UPI00193949CE|nr:uncharacterized protein LOC120343439 [Styela clava]
MRSLRAREAILIACAFVAYCMVESQLSLNGSPCQRSSLDLYFENDVTLEFEKFGFDCAGNKSQTEECKNATPKNSTRAIVNGKVFSLETDKEKFIPTLDEEAPEQEKAVGNLGPKLKTLTLMEDQQGSVLHMLNCEEIERLFSPDSPDEFHSQDGIETSIVSYTGYIEHPVLGRTPCILKKVNKEVNDGIPHRTLTNEFEKRKILGGNTKVTKRLLGECDNEESLSILVERDLESTTLCDDEQVGTYANSKCIRNEKLRARIEASEDKTRSAFGFIKEILCVFAEIERKKFFMQDINGKHISFSSNFSVHINNIDILSHHGSRNILSGSTCKYDDNCPAPTSLLWVNGSANRVVYEKCNDPLPLCTDRSCSGYNATLHMCGITRWILQPLYEYFHRIQDRSRMTQIMMSSMNSWPFLRRTAMEACSRATMYLILYDKDMKAMNQPVNNKKKSFHVGPRKPKPK